MKKIKIAKLNETIFYDQLPNGLEVYMLPNNRVDKFYVTFNTPYGSVCTTFRGEKEKKWLTVPDGSAHFLEHQMFYDEFGDSVWDQFSKLGSRINAGTNYDYTSYEVVGNESFKENVDLLLNYVQSPYFSEENCEKEKGIILEEIKMGKDQPSRVMYYSVSKCLFKNLNYRQAIIGDSMSVNHTTIKDLQTIYDYYYHPAKMFMIITGNFDPYKALEIIKVNQKNKKFNAYKNPTTKLIKEPDKVAKEKLNITMAVEYPRLSVAYKINLDYITSKDNYPQVSFIMDMILDVAFGRTSDLREELINDELIVGADIGAFCYIVDNFLLINIFATTEYPQKIIKIITEKINELAINEEELERKKKAYISSLVKSYDNIYQVNENYLEEIVSYHKVITNYYDIANNLKLSDVEALINKLSFKNQTIVTIKPIKKAAK